MGIAEWRSKLRSNMHYVLSKLYVIIRLQRSPRMNNWFVRCWSVRSQDLNLRLLKEVGDLISHE